MTGPSALPWPAYLDALEAWTRRADAAVRGNAPEPDAFEEEPDGPLPPELGVRARALLEQMHRVQEQVARRRAELGRARAYEQD